MDAALVSAARLRLYVASVKPLGSPIEIREVTGFWREDPDPRFPILEPTSDPTLISMQTVQKAKRFIYVDVTDMVKAWLADPSTNNGLVNRYCQISIIRLK